MASELPPGSTGGAHRTPPAPSAPRVSYEQRCVVLVNWWLERVEGEEGKVRVVGIPHAPQMRKGASSLGTNRKEAGRLFRSAAIATRRDDSTIETEDGCIIRIGSVLNIPRTQDNGFPQEVCQCFEFGFPPQWLKYLNPNMEQQNEHSQSESTANAPRHSVQLLQYYMENLSRDTFTSSMRYAFTENYFYSSTGYSSNTDGPAIQSLSNLTDGNAGNMAASWGLYGGTRNMPEKSLTPPGETCKSGQESDQHERTQKDAREQGIVNRSVSSVSVNLSTSFICPNTKVDESILVPSKIVSVEKEGYRSRVDCCQAEEAADTPENRNTQSCTSEQEMVTLPIDSAIVNENLNSTSSDLGEPGTPKCGKAGATDALELITEGMTPQFGAVRGSEDSTVRRLRSGKVFGTPSGGPVKRRYKKKNIQHEASSKMMAPNEGGTSTTDLTSHENDSSAAGIVAEDKEESHDSHRKDGNAGNMAASWGLYGGTRNMPEKPLTPPGETCKNGQESDQHERTQKDATEQGIVNHLVSSVSVNLRTGSICSNSKVDESILVPSKIVSVEKEGYKSRVDCCQAAEAADIPENRNTQSCSSEQEMVTLPIDSVIVNENLNSTSDLGEQGTPKCGKASMNLGSTDAFELTTEGMTPQFGAVRGSEDSTVRRLRSGKVFVTPSGGSVKRRYKKKNIQHEASSKMMAPNEGGTSTTDLTSHENESSAARIVAKDKEESHDSHRKGRGRQPNTKRKREWKRLFSSFL